LGFFFFVTNDFLSFIEHTVRTVNQNNPTETTESHSLSPRWYAGAWTLFVCDRIDYARMANKATKTAPKTANSEAEARAPEFVFRGGGMVLKSNPVTL